jgi:Flp pilus assembly protein TadG
MRRFTAERGTAVIDAAVTIPILLLVAVGIFECGRAYETWQLLTDAAREGAQIAILPNPVAGAAEARTRACMQDGQLAKYGTAIVLVNRAAFVEVDGAAVPASQVTIDYPFEFVLLQPIARLVNGSMAGSAVTMRASTRMRNEM